jgi:dTMP kinase
MTGRFIVLEGGEGAGKSTQVELLAERLTAAGFSVDTTREPGGTPEGVALRQKLLHGADLDPLDELDAFLEERRIHVEKRIRPNLAAGMIVVCDRYTPSSLAYQGVGRGLGVEVVEQRSSAASGGLEPDVVVVLDLPDEVAEARITGERDRLEREGEAFHATVRAAYRTLAAERGWAVVDGSAPPAAVADRVWAVVAAHL